jgi:acetyltransferase
VSSHTGTLAGSEKAYEAAFKQAGVIRAESIEDLFDLAMGFAQQPLPKNEHVAVITNAGGPGIMAADALERAGLMLASLSNETMEKLRRVLPAAASVLNPVDLLGDAGVDRFEKALNLIALDENVGTIMVILTPQVLTKVSEVARTVGIFSEKVNVPVFTCFIGEANTACGVRILRSHSVPDYLVPERAVAVIKAMVDQKSWQEQSFPRFEDFTIEKELVRKVFQKVLDERRLEIGEAEARLVAQACGIPIPDARLCGTTEEAISFAESIGYPVAMKIASPDILHKTDIGGVRLNIGDADSVRDTFDLLTFRARKYMPEADLWGCLVQKQLRGGKEVIIGMNRDPQFGPLVMFGLGGIYVEALKDVSFRIAPFSRQEAHKMIEEIRAFSLLAGIRGELPSDVGAIAEMLLRVSQLVTDFSEIVELDINPMMVFEKGQGAKALDMRLVLATQHKNQTTKSSTD